MDILFAIVITGIIAYAFGKKTGLKTGTQPANPALAMSTQQLMELCYLHIELEKCHQQKALSSQSYQHLCERYHLFGKTVAEHSEIQSVFNERPVYYRQYLSQNLKTSLEMGLVEESEYRACLKIAGLEANLTPDPETAPQNEALLHAPETVVKSVSVAEEWLQEQKTEVSYIDILKEKASSFSKIANIHIGSAKQKDPKDPLEQLLKWIDYFLDSNKTNWLTFLGVILVVISSIPIIQNMSSATMIYLILLLYSIGLFGAGFFIWKFFPWTGMVFYLVTLLIIPMDFMSITGLDMANTADILVTFVAFISLSGISYIILKTLASHYISPLYFWIFVFLGGCAAFMRELERVIANFGGGRMMFEYLILLLPFPLLMIGIWYQSKQLVIINEELE